jgi:cation diffusion facilitator family transporter
MIALTGNALISVMKFIAAFFTLSASMLAEAIHSTADCFNQIFLLIGKKRSAKGNDENHPFGYGAEEFFWGFMVAILLFFGGASFSIYEGIHKLLDPQPVQHVTWALVVLGLSIIIESKSFYVAYKELKVRTNVSVFKAIKKSTDVNLIVIVLEDAAALLGLVIAFVFTILAIYFPIFDAIGSIIIGLLLIYVSYSLVNELRKLIVGESMPREDRKRIKEILNGFEIVVHVNRIKTLAMGRSNYMLLASVNVEDFARGYNIEDLVAQIKLEIHEEFPQINEIYVEISED